MNYFDRASKARASEMVNPKVYADFQNLDDFNRVKLNCAGTLEDLARLGIELKEGMVLTFYTDDGNDLGRADELCGEGTVHRDEQELGWVAEINWGTLWHASEDGRNGEPQKLVPPSRQ